MAKPSESITLYGDRAEQFRQKRDELEDVLGHEPHNAQVVALMMADFDPSGLLGGSTPDPRRSR